MPTVATKIDKKIFEQLCVEQFSEKDIAEYFGVHRDTVNDFCRREYKATFSAYLALKKKQGQAILINKAMKLAETNPSVMIFMLKNWCHYKDRPTEIAENNEQLVKQFGEWFKDDKQADTPTT